MNKAFSLTGKAVIVTGAASCLGQIVCRELAASGARVIMVDGQDRDDLAELDDSLHNELLGATAIGFQADLGDDESVEELYSLVDSRFGVIDALIAIDAEILQQATSTGSHTHDFECFDSFPIESWITRVGGHCAKLIRLLQPACQRMSTQKQGSIVLLASARGPFGELPIIPGAGVDPLMPLPGAALHNLNHFIPALVRYLAHAYGCQNVRTNCVAIHHMRESIPKNYRETYAESLPMQRLCQARDISNAILFLASEAASYINGATIPVTGGMPSAS